MHVLEDTPYPPSNPAPTISELVHRLKKEDDGNFFYRGQTHFWPALIPSSYRRGMNDPNPHEPWVLIDENYADKQATHRDRVRVDAQNELMQVFGKAVGNIIAQQYGVASDTVDVTTDINVAAFFATRRYPNYRHFAGDETSGTGVIYRFRRWEDPPFEKDLEEALFNIGIEMQPPARVAWFRRRLSMRQLLMTGRTDILDRLQTGYFNRYGATGAALATRSVMASQSAIQQFYLARLAKAGVTFSDRELESTRLARQRGGLYFPSVSHLCWIPTDVAFRQSTRPGDLVVSPSLVLQRRMLAVLNGNYAAHATAFFFKHSAVTLQGIEPEWLWPDENVDSLFALVTAILREACAKYLSDKRVDICDSKEGILDRGYISS